MRRLSSNAESESPLLPIFDWQRVSTHCLLRKPERFRVRANPLGHKQTVEPEGLLAISS